MDIKKVSPILGIVALAWAMTQTGCALLLPTLATPRISVVDLHLQEEARFEQNYLVQLRIRNANDYEILIDGLQYDIELNNEHFVNGVSSQFVMVPGFGFVTLEVAVMSSLPSLVVQQLKALKQGHKSSIPYRISGKFHLDDFRPVPFEYQGELSVDNSD